MNDLGVVATLLAITTIEGFRLVPADSIILQRLGSGAWNVARERTRAGMHLVSWCIPVVLPVVLSPAAPELPRFGLRRVQRRCHARARRTRAGLAFARVLAIATLIAVVVVVPFATVRYGATGLVQSVAAVFALCTVQAAWTHRLMRRAGAHNRKAIATSLSVLIPFSSHRAPELVQSQIVAGLPPLAAAHALLGDEEFVRQLRRTVYDAAHANEDDAVRAMLTQLVDPARIAKRLGTSEDCDTGASFCPRCGAAFISTRPDCSDCGVPLIPCPSAPTR